ncbi:trna pseudouridine synthase d [Vairimorpha apis BRL 01]|uniref:Trna pseudouridine synthase d n=1 Tax=Vairimorpha apis BRL 01 TaxID=1037528 RepID=T0L8C3_9MICR|nr:trna pseudouridine synthase d [Vairimorpha apis BRL 01]
MCDPILDIKYFYNVSSSKLPIVIKDKPEDFIVHEITSNDEICDVCPIVNIDKYLKSLHFLNFCEKISENGVDEQIIHKKLTEINSNIYDSYDETLLNYKTKNYNPLLIFDKELRTKIHTLINYNPFVELKTSDSKITISFNSLHTFTFILNKCMLNTVNACKIIEKELNTPVSFSGNKDKKAITFQEVSLKCKFENLINFACMNNNLSNEDIKCIKIMQYYENFKLDEEFVIQECDFQKDSFKSYINIYNIKKGHSKKLGDLKGNKFVIKIKDRNDLCFKNIENGFINYFGLQRFGKCTNNHIVGKHILDKNYEQALEIIIKNSRGYEFYKNDDLNLCLKKCDNTERFIFKNIKKMKSKDIINKMRREIKMLYLHSYQSYLFNKKINENVENFCEDFYLELDKFDDKMLKGGKRKVIEKGYDVKGWNDGQDFVISFCLKPSCYATMALREL